MARAIVLLCMCVALSASALRVPFGKAKPALPPPPPEPTAPWEAPLLKAVAAPYFAYPAAIVQSRAVIESVFGTPSSTFEDNLREPAAGFLALYSPLGVLEGCLCLALAGAVALEPEDRSRVGAALAGTSIATLGALALAFATGLDPANAPALAAFAALTATTCALGIRAAGSVDDPIAMYKEDALEIIPFGTEEKPSETEITSFFYRSSTLTGILVGLSFLASPLSPIALFDTPEGPATHLMRQELGIYIVFLLAPIQAALFRAAKAGTLADATTRATNIVTGGSNRRLNSDLLLLLVLLTSEFDPLLARSVLLPARLRRTLPSRGGHSSFRRSAAGQRILRCGNRGAGRPCRRWPGADEYRRGFLGRLHRVVLLLLPGGAGRGGVNGRQRKP